MLYSAECQVYNRWSNNKPDYPLVCCGMTDRKFLVTVCGKRICFNFIVTSNTGCNQSWIVKNSPECFGNSIPKLSACMDEWGQFHCGDLFNVSRILIVWRAIINSSFVLIIRISTSPLSGDIIAECVLFFFSSTLMPRNSMPVQIRLRITDECSPIPPVKTRVSSPPRTMERAPIFLRAW